MTNIKAVPVSEIMQAFEKTLGAEPDRYPVLSWVNANYYKEPRINNNFREFKTGYECAVLERSPSVSGEAYEDAAQAIRYYIKHQNYPIWDAQDEYQKGVTITCENLEKIILEKHSLIQNQSPQPTIPEGYEQLLSKLKTVHGNTDNWTGLKDIIYEAIEAIKTLSANQGSDKDDYATK